LRRQQALSLKDGPAYSAADGEVRGFAGEWEDAVGGQGSANQWRLICGGLVAAGATAGVLSKLAQAHGHLWAKIVLESVEYVAFSAVAGAAGTRVAWSLLIGELPDDAAFSPMSVGAASVFLPSIALFYRQESLWMLLVWALATVTLAVRLLAVFPIEDESDSAVGAGPEAGALPSLYGLPGADSHPLRSFWIAVCAQAALVCAFRQYLLSAGLLLSACLCLLIVQWSALGGGQLWARTRKTPASLLYAVAILFTVLALLASLPSGAGGLAGSTPRKPPPPAATQAGRTDSGYVGIVLWPPPVKKTEIVPPAPRGLAIAGAAQPVIIPFDGPYWYFKAPSSQPGPRAHIAHGVPTELNIHSSDSAPLLMEAHQNLGLPIDLACCREIDVAIANADMRAGGIELGMLLSDGGSPGKPSLDLGLKPIASSELAQIPLGRPPVKEVLRFPIPGSARIHRFDAITLVFVPAKERARGGAKVSILSFELVPR